MMASGGEYLVHHGAAAHVGRFRAGAAGTFVRGDAVVVRSRRGLEIGEVLAPADGARVTLPDTFVGALLRPATDDDWTAAERCRAFGLALSTDGERLAAD